MAMAKCRECGTEVSDSAKTCPKCGISRPVKKKSILLKILAGFFVLAIIGNVISSLTRDSSTKASGSAVVVKLTPKEEAMAAVTLDKWDWYKGGFDSVMFLNAKIKNTGTRDVKDIEIECTHKSNSGTRIDSNKKIIYELVKAGKTISVDKFNMGFVHNQAKSTSCEITDLVLI